MQLVPELAKQVAELTVYQRTPIWVVPKIDGRVPRPVRRLFGALPAAQRTVGAVNFLALEALASAGVLHYRQAQLANRFAELLARAHLRVQVRDRETRRNQPAR